MKRLCAFILVLVLVLSLSVTAFAATGSITITNATKGDTYRLYKIFDATFIADGDDEDDKPEAVSYTLSDDEIYEYMFGASADVTIDEENGTRTNGFFVYVDATGLITKNENAKNSDIYKYLADMVRALDADNNKYLEEETATSEIVVFDGLAYGYYLIDKKAEAGIDVAVTITSNTPDVDVIDKNQKPATEFSKLIWNEDYRGQDENGNPIEGRWETSSSANIGDIVEFKVAFDATNYDGDQQIQYYSIMDTKGNAQWVEFNDVTVKVGDKELNKGYYHSTSGEHNTTEWEYLGNWGTETDPDKAEWYLIHYGFDKFEIVIPWMSGHDFTGTTHGFTLTYGENADSIYESPVDVDVRYTASVEPGASIGNPTNNNLWNSATLSWNPSNTTAPGTSTTTTTVYALGLHKIDAGTKASLADAEFKVSRNADGSDPVYVIPTDVKGVYILDDLNTFVSGEKRETSREKYAEYLEAYLQGEEQKNVVTTEANGKIVILGLEAGDYYLTETKAPNGYNILGEPEVVTVGETNNTFYIIVDDNGNVVDGGQVAEGYTRYDYTATQIIVENSKGVELPSTGGRGTFMLITFGTMIAIGFAILLITQKKMSVYKD